MADLVRRYTIHPPQLVGRLSTPRQGEEVKNAVYRMVGEFDLAMQELQRWIRYMQDANDTAQTGQGIGGVVGGTVDHGSIAGLADDDHDQYLKEKTFGGLASEIPLHDHSGATEAGTVEHSDLTGLLDDDHTQYIRVDGTRPFTGDQSMGQNSLTAVEGIEFDTTPAAVSANPGALFWDTTDKTLAVNLNDDVTLQIGQEEHVLILNHSLGYTLANGRVVKCTGTQAYRVTGDYANYTLEDDHHHLLGVITEDIENNTEGYVTTRGIIREINTNSWNEGDILYLAGTQGQLSNVAPSKPYHVTCIGMVLRKSATVGMIYVDPRTFPDLDEANDVELTAPLLDTKETLIYDSTPGVWRNSEVFHRKHGFEVSSAGAALVTMSYNAGTRQMTITPTGATFNFWIDGVKFTKTGAQTTAAHANVSNFYYIYYDATGALQVGTSPWSIVNRTVTPVCYLIYDSTVPRGICYYEAHTADRQLEWHYIHHFSEGTEYISGGDLTGYVAGAGGDTDANVTYAIGSVKIADEDIIFDTNSVPDGGPYLIFWRTGAAGDWTWSITDTFPFKAGATYPQRNQWTGATWQLTEVGDAVGRYLNYFIFAVPACSPAGYGVLLIPGQTDHASITAARLEYPSSLSLGTLPFQELAAVWRITLLCRSTLGGTYNVRIEEVARITGAAIVTAAGGGGVTDHGALTGLADDDHTQYLLADGTRGLSAAWDAGSWQIRAETFQSDVATGTAPLTVASTTLVSNLNVDQVDGEHASAFEHTANKGAASGYASLDASSIVQEKVKILRQGLEAALPALPEGELYWATDTDTLYIGT